MGEGRAAKRAHQDPRDEGGPPRLTAVLGEAISVNVEKEFSSDRANAHENRKTR